jgi:hypothetical protein
MLKLSIEEIGILTGILSAIITGGYFLIKKIEEKRVKIREKLNTKWENAGEASFGTDTHNLFLELEVDLEDGEINGVLKSECLSTGSTSPLCSLVGKLRYKTANIELWHSRFGEGIFYGKAKITFKNKNLVWQIKKDPTNIFPRITTLFKRYQEISKQ